MNSRRIRRIIIIFLFGFLLSFPGDFFVNPFLPVDVTYQKRQECIHPPAASDKLRIIISLAKSWVRVYTRYCDLVLK